MRDVIVAANWKMHTTPADAGDLAATIAARTRVAGRDPGHLPAVRLPGRGPRRARATADPDVAVGAQNVHHELAGAYTGEIAAPMLVGLATWVIVGHSERRRDAGETDALIGRKLGRAIDAGPAPDPVRRRAARPTARRAGRRRSSTASSAARSRTTTPAAPGRGAAWSSPTSRSGPSAPAATPRGADAAAMAEAIRAALAGLGLAGRRRRRAGALRRERDLGQHRRVPGRAVDRWRARRRGVAQARRDGRHRRPGRGLTAARPAAWPRDGRGRPRPHRPHRPRRLRDRSRPGRRRDRRGADADLARAARALAARRLRASEDAVGLPPGQMGNSEVGPSQPRRGPAGPPGPAADRRRDRRRLVLRAARRSSRRARGHATGRRPLHVVSLIGPGGVHANDRHLVALASSRRAKGVAARPRSMRCSTAATRRRRSALGFVADLEARLAAAHPDAPHRDASAGATTRWTATGAGTGPNAATTRSSTARRPVPLRPRSPRSRRPYARGETDEFVAPTVIDGVGAPAPRRRRDRPRQLPRRPGPPADPRPGRRPGLRWLRPDLAAGRPRRRDLLVVTMTAYEDGPAGRRSPSRPRRPARWRRRSARPAGASSTSPRPRSTRT